MKKIIITLIILILSLSGCTPEDQLKAGVIIPLSGDFASYGSFIQNGLEMAQQDLKAQGLDIELVYEDGCLPEEATKASVKLLHIDDVEFMSGIYCLASVHPILAMTEESEKSVMMAATPSQDVIDVGDYIFSTAYSVTDEATTQAEYSIQELNASTASILYIASPWGQGYNTYFKKRFEELGGTVVSSEILGFYDTDFRTQITKIKENDPDLILIVHVGDQLGIAINQIREMNIDSVLMGTSESSNPQVFARAAEHIEGFIISYPQVLATQQFIGRYQELHGMYPDVISANAYDGLQLQVRAYYACDGDRACIKEQMLATRDYSGVSGNFSITNEGVAKKQIVFKKAKNGEFIGI